MFDRLRKLFARQKTPAVSTDTPMRGPRHVHVFTCAFDTEQGFFNYADVHWSTQDAEPFCPFEQDLGLSYLNRDFVELLQEADLGGADALDRHLRRLLRHPADADRVFIDTPGEVRQVILIYDNALPDGTGPLRATPSARLIGHFELTPELA